MACPNKEQLGTRKNRARKIELNVGNNGSDANKMNRERSHNDRSQRRVIGTGRRALMELSCLVSYD